MNESIILTIHSVIYRCHTRLTRFIEDEGENINRSKTLIYEKGANRRCKQLGDGVYLTSRLGESQVGDLFVNNRINQMNGKRIAPKRQLTGRMVCLAGITRETGISSWVLVKTRFGYRERHLSYDLSSFSSWSVVAGRCSSSMLLSN